MSDDSTRPIVIKRKKVVAGGAHGGAWKIAYADFVTAMMAFFLLMWLLGSTAKGDLQGIADHFQNPLKVSSQGGSGSGDATSVLQGGGKDLTRQTGQVKNGEVEAQRKTVNLAALKAEERKREQQRLQELKEKVEDAGKELQCIKTTLLASMQGYAPQVAIEFGRKVLYSPDRPTFTELESHVKGKK